MKTHGLAVMRSPCDQCLFSRNRIVSAERKAQILADCARKDRHFECHKGTIAGERIVCAGFAKRHDSQALQVARRLGLIVLVDGPGEVRKDSR